MTELAVLTLILGNDAFWLMDRLGERGLNKLAVHWHALADQHGWVRRA